MTTRGRRQIHDRHPDLDRYRLALQVVEGSGRNVWQGFQAFLVAVTILFTLSVKGLADDRNRGTPADRDAGVLLASIGAFLCVVWIVATLRLWGYHNRVTNAARGSEPRGWHLLSEASGPLRHIRTRYLTYVLIGAYLSGFTYVWGVYALRVF